MLAYRRDTGVGPGPDSAAERRTAAADRGMRRQRRFRRRIRYARSGGDLWRRSAGDRPHPARFSFSRNRIRRSEEHTSELQSLMRISYAVFCLKKKKDIK